MAFASPGILVAAGEGGQPGRVTDNDSRSLTRDNSALLELRERARDELSNGAEPRRELRLGQGQLEIGALLDGPRERRLEVAGEPLGHRPEGEVADNGGEVTQAASQSLQHGERDSRASLTELKHLGAWEEQRLRGRERDCRGDVPTAVEERPFPERGARSFGVKHLLTAPKRDLPHLDAPVGDDEKTATGLSFLKEGLAAAKMPQRAPSAQTSQLVQRQRSEVRDLPQSRDIRARALSSRFALGRDSSLAHESEA